MSLGIVGNQADPFSGRAWVRTFEGGHVELLYRSGEGPGETEQFNEWMQDAGIDNRIGSLRPKFIGGEPRPKQENAESNQERSTRRAKQRVRWLVKAMDADQLLTLTYRENQTDYALSKKHLARFNAMCRREWPTWKHVSLPEEQKRGAWHWHVAVKGWQNYDKLRGFWWRALGYKVVFSTEGKPVLKDGGDTPGNVQGETCKSRGRKLRQWTADKMSAYMGKYITKAIGADGVEGAAYSASRGLTWRVERYAVRALTFGNVREAVQGLLSDLAQPYVWVSGDRSVIWAAGRSP